MFETEFSIVIMQKENLMKGIKMAIRGPQFKFEYLLQKIKK